MVYRRLGRLADALTAYRKAHQIMVVVVERTPGVAQWKNNLALLENQIVSLEKQMQTAQQ